jgi:hydroxypyruvate isomerase
MPKLAANLSMQFNEVPFLERFARAAQAGFEAVEFLFPYDHGPEELAALLKRNGLEQALFNLPPGDWEAGERGLAALPGREAAFRDGLERALPYAQALGCRRVHMMAGIPAAGAEPRACGEVYAGNLRAAAQFFAPHGVEVLLEPINTRDIPGYFLNHQSQAVALLDALGAPNAGLQMDFYHCQIMDGDLATHLRANFSYIRHVQIAGVPERHEPDIGEVNYAYLLDLLDQLGYDGWVGCEYRPAGDTLAGLGWARPYGIAAPMQP